ncbi:MAG TPA: sigma-70 family RNA polymerase sigma factor [Candidatus Synoicihabitans sp.]|nr:sigma-70 family RNA polymerase sigma factor [Candidatus Synoicihabitans sp.]
MIEDIELLRRYVAEKSEAAFAELVRRRIDGVYASALRRLGGDEHLARDVTQQVFAALARQARSLCERTVLAGWLFLTTRNFAAQVVRTERRRRHREQEAFAMQELTTSSLDFAADWSRLRPVLDHVLDELSDSDREAVLLRFFENRSFADVSEKLGITENAARMRVVRALDKLHAQLARRGITSTTTALGLALTHQTGIAAPSGLAATVAGTALSNATIVVVDSLGGICFSMTTMKLVTAGAIAAAIGVGSYQLGVDRAEPAKPAAPLTPETGDPEEIAAPVPPPRFEATFDPVETAATRIASHPAVAQAMPTATGTSGFISFMPSTGSAAEDRRRVREINGRTLDSMYADLYRQMEFSPEQCVQFRELMLDVRERGSALFKQAVADERSRNPGASRESLQDVFDATVQQTESEITAAVRVVFGEATAEAFELYRATLPARHVANKVARALADTASPITDGQKDALAQIIAQHSPMTDDRVNPNTMSRESVVAEAGTVLSAPQVAILRQVIQGPLDR